MPSKLQMLIDLALQQKGAYGAKRVQRAADEIANLEKRYTEGALRDAFLGDNAKAVVTMPPGKFEKYAEPLPFSTEEQRQKYIQYLSTLKGFEDVPFLEINKAPKTNKTIISGHEGRHRSRALEALGDEQSLVRIMPRAALREPLPRRSQEEYIEALRKEIGERPLVIPEGGGTAIELPDIYKDGGAVKKAGGGRMLKNVAEMAAELASKKSKAIQPSAKPAAIDLEKIKSGGIEVPTSGFSKEQKSVLRPLYNQGLIRVEERDGKKMVVPGKGAWYEFSTPEQKAVLDSLQTSQGVKDLSLMGPTESLLNSAQASFFDFEIVPGVRNFSINKFEPFLPGYDSPNELKRIEELADKIRESKQIEPLFVGVDPTGEPYIMEGQHRIRALKSLGYDEIPARVVIDMDDPNGMKKGGPVHMADAGSVDEAIRAATGKAPVGGKIIQSKTSDVEQAFRDKLAREQAEREQAVKAGLSSAITEIPGFAADVAVDLPYYLAQKAAGRTPKPLAFGETVRGAVGRAIGAYPPEREQAELSKPSQYGNITDALSILSSIATGGPQAAAYRAAGKAGRVMGKEGLRAIDEAMQTGQGPLAGGLAAIMPRRIDVYHGSPHRFPPTERNPLGEFDPSKIGTGEGAQMYGYGHYVAEAPDVAKSYVPRSPIYEEKLLRKYNAAQNAGNYPMMEVLEDAMLHRTPQEIVERFAGEEAGYTAAHQKAAADFAKWAAKNPPEVGGFYKVDLPDEQIEKMLDWDKPLSEQPDAVQEFAKIKDSNLTSKEPHFITPNGKIIHWSELLEDVNDLKNEKMKNIPSKIFGGGKWVNYGDYMMGKTTGGDFYKSLSSPSEWSRQASAGTGKTGFDDIEASAALKEAGIPGIKYLDASSRGAGEGTRNFVIFPGGEELLTIKERMKKGGPVHKQYGGVLRRMAKYGKQFEPSKKTEIFIGEKSNLWNAGAAAKAESLEKAGVDPVDIWKQTGTFRSPDGKLRQEISDVGSKFRGKDEMKALAESMKAQENELKSRIAESKAHPDLFPKQLTEAQKAVRKDIKAIRERRTMEGGPEYNVGYGNRAEFVLEHPELYEAYPILRGIDVQQGGVSGGTKAGYIGGINENDPGLINIYQAGLSSDPRSSMTHEIQHAIQGIENWGRGGNPLTAFENPEAFKILENLRKAASTPTPFDEFAKNYEGLQPDEIKKKYDEYVSSIPKVVKTLDRDLQSAAANQYYNRLAGEAEARAVQERINMTPQERMETFPLSSYDVLPEDVIVKRKKKGGPVSQDAMNIAVMDKAVRKQVGGSARRIAMRSIEEATRLLQAAKNTRSKAAQIEAGLYHPIGGGVKMDKPIELMKAETKADKSIKMVPRRAATFEEMQGGIAIPLVGDRAAAGRILTGVGGLKLKRPVTLEGGGEYMLTHTVPDSDESSVWSSGKGVISGLQKQARIASEYGNPVYGINVVGSPTMVDFNTMLSEALLGQYDPTNLTKKARKEFLRELHNYAPDPSKPHLRPGKAILAADLDDPEMLREKLMAPGAGELRKAFANRMNLAPIQEAGFPNVAEARFAITDPRLVNAPLGTAGFTIGKINPEGIALERTVREHKSYPIGLAGEYFGSLDEPIDYREIFRDFYNKRRLMGKPEISDWRSFGMSPQFQPIDQELVDAIMSKGHKPREWKKGGKVTKKAVGGAMSAAQKAARAFVEARKAKGMPEYHQDWQKALQRGETPPAAPATKEQLDAEMQRLLETDKYKEMNRGGKVTNFGKKKKTITIDAMRMAVADKKLKGKKHG